MNEPSDSPNSSPTPQWVRDLAHDANVFPICFFIVLFVFVAFYPSLENGFVQYDDHEYVTSNAVVSQGLTWQGVKWAFTNIVSGNWHPLTMISHMLDCSMFGLKPWGHHLTSLLFHAANCVLVFVVLRKLTGATGRSIIVALLFGLHPLRVESVAWVAERKDVLSGFFFFLTIWAYTDYVKELATKGLKANSFFWRALVFFIIGLMCKPMLVTLPFVLLLLDFWPLRRDECQRCFDAWKRLVLEKVPFFFITAATCIVTIFAQKHADAIVSDQSLSARIENAVIACWRYIGKLFWPVNLAVIYPSRDFWPLTWVSMAALAFFALIYLAIRLRKKAPYLTVGWFWYLGMLVPVIGLVQVGLQSMADRYAYLPMIGLLIALVWGLYDLTRTWHLQASASVAACGVISIACIAATHHQLGYWKNGEILFRHTLAITKNNTVAHNNFAVFLSEKGDYDGAVSELRQAIKSDSKAPKLHYNLALMYSRMRRFDEALPEYYAAIKLRPEIPEYHSDLAGALLAKGRVDDALHEYENAIRLNPRSASIHCSYGDALLLKNRLDDAVREYREALQLEPQNEGAKSALARALQNQAVSPIH